MLTYIGSQLNRDSDFQSFKCSLFPRTTFIDFIFRILRWKTRVGGETEEELVNNAFNAMYEYYEFVVNGVSEYISKGSIFLRNRHFIIQERFNKLIYGINTTIKCGT